MKILIIGAGEVGHHLARVLSAENHQITMVDLDSARLARLEDQLDIKGVAGHGASASVLERAGGWGADIVLAVTNSDETNMLASYFAKVQGAKRTIVRIRQGDFLAYHRYFYRNVLGVDSILVPNELCAQEIIELVRARQAVAVENFAEGRVQMRQVQVTDKSAWANQKLARIKMPPQTLVTAIVRGREILIPNGDSRIMPEDELLVIGKTNQMDQLDKYATRRKFEPRLVIIVGGGELGFSVAQYLEETEIRVKLIEENRGRAEYLSGELDDVVVVHGDGTDAALLREIGADHADVFISSSGIDEKNLMSCQLAKNMGAKKAIALVKKPDYVTIYQQLGVDAAISPRLLVAQSILRYVRSGAIASLAVIGEGKAEVIQMRASDDSKIASAPLTKVGFPRGAIISAVSRNGEVFIPDGDSRIKPGDDCIIFTFVQTLPQLEKFFSGKRKSFLNSLTGGQK
ncbi:MAG: Trk system potassium transporter TrkA [bacterium]